MSAWEVDSDKRGVGRERGVGHRLALLSTAATRQVHSTPSGETERERTREREMEREGD